MSPVFFSAEEVPGFLVLLPLLLFAFWGDVEGADGALRGPELFYWSNIPLVDLD